VTIFTVSTGGAQRAMTEGRGGMSASIRDMDYLMGDNEMKNFAASTGGMSFFPRFAGEMPDIFGRSIRRSGQNTSSFTIPRRQAGRHI